MIWLQNGVFPSVFKWNDQFKIKFNFFFNGIGLKFLFDGWFSEDKLRNIEKNTKYAITGGESCGDTASQKFVYSI